MRGSLTPGSDDRSGVVGEARLCLCGILPMDYNETDISQILNISLGLLEDLGSVTTARLERSRFGSESRTQIKCHEPVHRRALPRPNRSAFLWSQHRDLFQERATDRSIDTGERPHSRFFWIRQREIFNYSFFRSRNSTFVPLRFFFLSPCARKFTACACARAWRKTLCKPNKKKSAN